MGEYTEEEIEILTKAYAKCEMARDDRSNELERRVMMTEQMPYTEKDICVCCGRYVPEGRQVCPICEKEVDDD